MKLGTRSVLFGVHCFWIHPLYVALAWIRLYGWPWHPLTWVAFFVHDLGYIGLPDMDGDAGETHVFRGAWIMGALGGRKWYSFALYHSRFWAKYDAANISWLCVADKYSFCITPRWLYLLLAYMSGELWEYMDRANKGKYSTMNIDAADAKRWHASVKEYLGKWVEAHKYGGEDTWTPAKEQKEA